MKRLLLLPVLHALIVAMPAQAQLPTVEFSLDDDFRYLFIEGEHSQRFGPLNHSMEMVCARARDGLYDVYVTDGNGAVFHYATDTEELRLLRVVAVNPDTDACGLAGDDLLILDPVSGIWRTPADAEGEPILVPVSLFAPWGELPPGTEEIPASFLQSEDSSARERHRQIHAARETEPVEVRGDAADDPAIVVDPRAPARTLILGTDKTGGLRTYDRAGNELQNLEVGRLNNVDAVVYGSARAPQAVAVASNRTYRRIDFFSIDLLNSHVSPTYSWPLEFEDPYGICLFYDRRINVIVGDSEGRVQHWAFDPDTGASSAELLADMHFATQTEGCDVDVDAGVAWIGEEDAGVWRVPLADPDARELRFAVDGETLFDDVEGIRLVVERDGRKRLAVSSQGDSTLVVFDLASGAVDAKLRVGMHWSAGVDGVSDTDGIDVTTIALPGFPGGLLVMQDGRNVAPPQNQNFKFIDWRQIDVP